MFAKVEKAYLCSTCFHSEVCKFMKDYKKAQDRVDTGMIDVLVETAFVEPVKLSCKFYSLSGIVPRPR